MKDARERVGDIIDTPPIIQRMFGCNVEKIKIVSYSAEADAYLCQSAGANSGNATPSFVCDRGALVMALYAKELKGVRKMNYKIVVTTDGCDTVATLYDGKAKKNVAKTRCHPNDEFDFGTGAQIAVERLIACSRNALNKPLPVNGYAVCNHTEDGLTQGNVYRIRGGFFVDDDADRRPATNIGFASADEVNGWHSGLLTLLSGEALQTLGVQD